MLEGDRMSLTALLSSLDGMDDSAAADQQVEAIVRGARHLLERSRERAHVLSAVLRVYDQYDTASAIMRASESADAGKYRVAELLGLDQRQARAVAGITMAMLPRREHRQMVEEHGELVARIADLESVLASRERQRGLVGTERGSYLAGQVSE
jgi:DNA gyrase subunit A